MIDLTWKHQDLEENAQAFSYTAPAKSLTSLPSNLEAINSLRSVSMAGHKQRDPVKFHESTYAMGIYCYLLQYGGVARAAHGVL